MWLHKNKINNSLVVFVHGILGDQWGTWKGVPGMLQSVTEHDRFIRSYDFYSFKYDSSFFQQPPLRPFAVDDLRRFLAKVDKKYATVVLIAHSQGGLLVKSFIIEELLAGKGHTLKVDLVITLGTPHFGRKALNPVHFLQQIPVLKSLLPFHQLGQLAARSETVKFVQTHWNERQISRVPGTTGLRKRYIRSIAVVGAYDIWAGSAGSQGYDVDIPQYISAGHAGLKPRSTTEALVDLVIAELQNHLRPDLVLEEINRCRVEESRKGEFIRDNALRVAKMVKENRSDLSPSEIENKAGTLIRDFLFGFGAAPLRGVDINEALALYVERSLGEES
jgi:Alpha/beta hydrolase family